MHKPQLIEAVAEKAGITQEQAKNAIDAMFDTITGTVAKGEKVTLVGFGSWERVQRPAREYRNPHDGGKALVPATFVPKFKVGAGFRGLVRGEA